MSISASEIEKLEGTKPTKRRPKKYTEEFRVEAVEYYKKARQEFGKNIKQCADELGVNDKTLGDWIMKLEATGKVTQARTDEQKELAKAQKRIKELEMENEFLKKAAAFFAKSLA